MSILKKVLKAAFPTMLAAIFSVSCSIVNPDPAPNPGKPDEPDKPDAPSVTDEEGHIVVNTILDDEQQSSLIGIQNGTVIFEGTEMSNLQVGQAIVSDITDNAPYGFMYKVKSVSVRDGKTYIETDKVGLSDVIEEGEGSTSYIMTADMIESIEDEFGNPVAFASTKGDFGVEASVSFPIDISKRVEAGPISGSMNLNGNFTLKLGVDLSFSFSGWHPQKIEVAFSPEMKLDLKTTAAIGVEGSFKPIIGHPSMPEAELLMRKIGRIRGKAVSIQVGMIPVVVRPVADLYLKISAEGKIFVECKLVELDNKYRFGFGFTDTDGFYAIHEDQSKDPKYLDLSNDGKVAVEGSISIAPSIEGIPELYNWDLTFATVGLAAPSKIKLSEMTIEDFFDGRVNPKTKVTTELEVKMKVYLGELIGINAMKYIEDKLGLKTKFEPKLSLALITWYDGYLFPKMSEVSPREITMNSASLSYTFLDSKYIWGNLKDYGFWVAEGYCRHKEDFISTGYREFSFGELNLGQATQMDHPHQGILSVTPSPYELNTYTTELQISNLAPGTTYSVLPYHKTFVGQYGTPTTFTTAGNQNSLRVTTMSPSPYAEFADFSGSYEPNGTTVSEYGFIYSTSTSMPTLRTNDRVISFTDEIDNQSSMTTYEYRCEGLTPRTTYNVRAYARNESGVIYGNTKTFTTRSNVNPLSVSTGAPTDVDDTSAKLHATFSDGGLDILERGYCVSHLNNGSSVEDCEYNIVLNQYSDDYLMTQLSPDTKYQVRAYARNEMGTVYGKLVKFTTLKTMGAGEFEGEGGGYNKN